MGHTCADHPAMLLKPDVRFPDSPIKQNAYEKVLKMVTGLRLRVAELEQELKAERAAKAEARRATQPPSTRPRTRLTCHRAKWLQDQSHPGLQRGGRADQLPRWRARCYNQGFQK